MKKILYIIHGYPPHNHAGTENYSYSLAKEIANTDHTVSVFYPILVQNSNHIELFTKKIDNHTAYQIITSHHSIINNLFNEEAELAFDKVIQHFSPDIIHFQHIHSILPFSLMLKSVTSTIPTVITLHDYWYICPKTYMLNEDGTHCDGPTSPEKCAKCFFLNEDINFTENKNLFFYTTELFAKRLEISRLIFSKANLTTAPSKFLLDKYKQFVTFRQSIRLPLGLDTSGQQQYKTYSKSIRFGFLGNIAPLKNVHGLIESFSRTTGEATLHVYGKMNNGELANALNYLASKDNRIVLHGSYHPNDLCNILSQIDVGIVPSFFENYPLVAREFLNAKIPVIASRVGGIPEIITHNNNGLLFNPLHTDELQRCIQTFIDDPRLISALQENIDDVKNIEQDARVWSEIYNSMQKQD